MPSDGQRLVLTLQFANMPFTDNEQSCEKKVKWESAAILNMPIAAPELFALVCVQALKPPEDMRSRRDVAALSDCGRYNVYHVRIRYVEFPMA